MKILFVSPSYKPAYIYGGPAVSVTELAEALVIAGHEVTVYTTTANGREELKVPVATPVNVNGVTVYYFSRQTGDHTHISFGLWQQLWKNATTFDTINLQSWWSLLIIGAAVICRAKRCIYIISPRGMLSAYTFQNLHGRPKKWIHKAVGKKLLKTGILHATTDLEWSDCQKIIPGWKGFVLPNLVRFPATLPARQYPTGDTLTLGFLSRIDQKKGLELTMQALALQTFKYRLKIGGGGEEGYLQSLKTLAASLKIDHRIQWCGWISGDNKFDFLASLDVFILTSYNENFANTVIESLSVGTPVFISRGVGLAGYVESESLGWVCDTSVTAIANKFAEMAADREKMVPIGKMAPEKIRADFNKMTLAGHYANAYKQFIRPPLPTTAN